MSNTAPAGFFSGANGLDPSNKLPWFPPNFNGRCRVDVCKKKFPRAGGRAFIAELTILTSNLSHLDPIHKDYVAVGARHSWYQSIGADASTGYAACIGFLYACIGLDKNQDRNKIEVEIKPHQEKWLDRAVSEENALQGAEILVQTSTIITKKSEPFTLHNFMPAPRQATA